jgi:hypothetical protein
MWTRRKWLQVMAALGGQLTFGGFGCSNESGEFFTALAIFEVAEDRDLGFDLMLLVIGAEADAVGRNRVDMKEMVTRRRHIEGEDTLGCAWVFDLEIAKVIRFAGLLEMSGEVSGYAEADRVFEAQWMLLMDVSREAGCDE